MQDILLQLQTIVEKAGYPWWKPGESESPLTLRWADNYGDRVLLFHKDQMECLQVESESAETTCLQENPIGHIEFSATNLQDNLENFLDAWVWLVGGDKEYQSLQMLHEKNMSQIGER